VLVLPTLEGRSPSQAVCPRILKHGPLVYGVIERTAAQAGALIR
jgi:hypothetical protein